MSSSSDRCPCRKNRCRSRSSSSGCTSPSSTARGRTRRSCSRDSSSTTTSSSKRSGSSARKSSSTWRRARTCPIAASSRPARSSPVPMSRASLPASSRSSSTGRQPALTRSSRSRAVQSRNEVVVKDMFETLQAGKALDAPRVKEAVTSMTDSVVRNPDAMLLLAKMKEKGGHTLDRAMGVSIYMITFGRFLQLPREQLDLLGMVGLLQDIGKTRVPEDVLNKKEPLSKVELAVARSHVSHSVDILKETNGLPPELPGLAALHHERYDGSGYLNGLKGVEIGLFGSIAGLVDCFDALTHPRPYAEALAPSNALSMLYNWRDTRFDRPLVEQFIQCIGIYPVGALVELNSGDIGIVIAQNMVRRLQPRVMVVIDAKGNRLNPQLILDLARDPMKDKETPYRIKRTLEKGSVAIDSSEFFL